MRGVAFVGASAAVPAPARELMAPVKGGRIYVRVNGDQEGQRPPLVLIHGGPGGTHKSLLDATELADERAIILYDQLDSGLSDRPDDPRNWVVERVVDELRAIAEALRVTHWHALGHSWGGTIALEYGARRPAALRGLALARPLISTRTWLADANALRRRLPAGVQRDLDACEAPVRPAADRCEAAVEAFMRTFNGREPASPALSAYKPVGDRGFNARLYETMWGASEFVSTGTLKDYRSSNARRTTRPTPRRSARPPSGRRCASCR